MSEDVPEYFRPTKTNDQIIALPIWEGLDYIEHPQDDGTIKRIPMMIAVQAQCFEPDDIICAYDDEGEGWSPYLHDDVWYRKRAGF